MELLGIISQTPQAVYALHDVLFYAVYILHQRNSIAKGKYILTFPYTVVSHVHQRTAGPQMLMCQPPLLGTQSFGFWSLV